MQRPAWRMTAADRARRKDSLDIVGSSGWVENPTNPDWGTCGYPAAKNRQGSAAAAPWGHRVTTFLQRTVPWCPVVLARGSTAAGYYSVWSASLPYKNKPDAIDPR